MSVRNKEKEPYGTFGTLKWNEMTFIISLSIIVFCIQLRSRKNLSTRKLIPQRSGKDNSTPKPMKRPYQEKWERKNILCLLHPHNIYEKLLLFSYNFVHSKKLMQHLCKF